jgi:hypothetical protein
MQIKGAEASAKPGATAHQNAWQRWSHGQFNDRSGSVKTQARVASVENREGIAHRESQIMLRI